MTWRFHYPGSLINDDGVVRPAADVANALESELAAANQERETWRDWQKLVEQANAVREIAIDRATEHEMYRVQAEAQLAEALAESPMCREELERAQVVIQEKHDAWLSAENRAIEAQDRAETAERENTALREAMDADPYMPFDVLARRHKVRLSLLEAECDRLRAALERIAWMTRAGGVGQIARAALDPQGGETKRG